VARRKNIDPLTSGYERPWLDLLLLASVTPGSDQISSRRSSTKRGPLDAHFGVARGVREYIDRSLRLLPHGSPFVTCSMMLNLPPLSAGRLRPPAAARRYAHALAGLRWRICRMMPNARKSHRSFRHALRAPSTKRRGLQIPEAAFRNTSNRYTVRSELDAISTTHSDPRFNQMVRRIGLPPSSDIRLYRRGQWRLHIHHFGSRACRSRKFVHPASIVAGRLAVSGSSSHPNTEPTGQCMLDLSPRLF
jgi:hypothetical protein